MGGEVTPDVVEPRSSSALHVSTGGSQPCGAAATRCSAADSSLAAPSASIARSPSALLIAITSASSSTPFLIPCRLSPVRASISSRNVSTIAGDRGLGLADADRLDEHDVVAGRLEHHDRLARRSRDAAEPPGARRGADERVVAHGEPRHPRLVAEDAAAGALRGRVDREHGDAVPVADQVHPHRVDERRLAGAGHARDPDPVRRRRRAAAASASSSWATLLVVGPGGLDERDRPPDRRPVGAPAPRRRARTDIVIAPRRRHRCERPSASERIGRLVACVGAGHAAGELFEELGGGVGDDGAGREDRRRAGRAQLVEVLRRDHAADDDQDVVAAELARAPPGAPARA